jgi:hypothetical protein
MKINAIYRPKGSFSVSATVLIEQTYNLLFSQIAKRALRIKQVASDMGLHTALAENYLPASIKLVMSSGTPFEMRIDKAVFDIGVGHDPHITLINGRSEVNVTLQCTLAQIQAMAELPIEGSHCSECGKPLDRAALLGEMLICPSCTKAAQYALNQKLGLLSEPMAA